MSSHSMSSLTKQDCFIEGHWVPTEKRFAVTNPANGEVITEVADADGEFGSVYRRQWWAWRADRGPADPLADLVDQIKADPA